MMTRITSPPLLPNRPRDGHKGLFGRVLVVGGHDAMLGAPVLAATAALRCGSGLVQIAMPRDSLTAALSITPELIGLPLGANGSKPKLLEAAKKADTIVLGPGLGESAAARSIVLALVTLDQPMVIDADALNLLAAQKKWPRAFAARAILTPHPGEMKRLAKLFGRRDVPTDDDGRIGIAIEAASAFKSIVVLKGHRTIVTDGEKVFVNRTGDSTLSKAGAGDVLSGAIASLIGQKMQPFDAACAGVFIHGKAGERTGEKWGLRSGLARDVIEALPAALIDYARTQGETEISET